MLHRLSTAALLVVLLVPLTACDGWPLQSKAAAEAPPWQNEHAGDSSVQGTSLNAAIHRAAGGQRASKFVVTGSIYDPRQIWYVGEEAAADIYEHDALLEAYRNAIEAAKPGEAAQ